MGYGIRHPDERNAMASTNGTKRRKGLKANYGGATPEQVARAVGRYRPNKPNEAPASGSGT